MARCRLSLPGGSKDIAVRSGTDSLSGLWDPHRPPGVSGLPRSVWGNRGSAIGYTDGGLSARCEPSIIPMLDARAGMPRADGGSSHG